MSIAEENEQFPPRKFLKAGRVAKVRLTGQTVAVATVLPTQLRPVNQRDISHVRQLAQA